MAPGEKIVRRIDSKICVVEGPAPAEDLSADLERLRLAAAAEDHEAVLHRLRRLVPDYRPLLPAGKGDVCVAAGAPVM